jgi:hypothetical protein
MEYSDIFSCFCRQSANPIWCFASVLKSKVITRDFSLESGIGIKIGEENTPQSE